MKNVSVTRSTPFFAPDPVAMVPGPSVAEQKRTVRGRPGHIMALALLKWVFNTWFLGRPEIVDVRGLGGPKKTLQKGASPPTFWKCCWGRRGQLWPHKLTLVSRRTRWHLYLGHVWPNKNGPSGTARAAKWHQNWSTGLIFAAFYTSFRTGPVGNST